MADVLFESCLSEVSLFLKEKKGFEFCLKDEQISCLRQLFLGKDLLAVLPTGFGKSMIFQSLVLMAQRRSVKDGNDGLGYALIITPLNSIIKDQIKEVTSIGLTACSLAEQVDKLDEVTSGKYMFVYASAESVMDKRFLSSLKKDSCFRKNLVACVVDETHTVETWTGMRGAKSKARRQATAFRAAYGELATLRSFLKEGTPLAALTGTADANTLATVTKELALKEPLILKISPNRENIRISVVKSKKGNILFNLDWLVECIKLNGELTPKTIIFCNTMNDIACVANYLMLKLGKWAYYPQERKESKSCLIGIYHSSSWSQNQEKVLNSLKGELKIRVVISSTALSMGVNFPNIRYIINWGPARNLLDQHQEFGRAGRDGLQSHALVLFHGHQLSQCEQTVKDFVKSEECLRVAAYKTFDENIKPANPPHKCCSHCSLNCKCAAGKCSAEPPMFERDIEDTASNTGILTRPVTPEDQHDLKEALTEVQQGLSKGCGLLDSVSAHGFSSELVEDVIKNCSRIFTVNDVIETCPLFSLDSALKILEIIQEVFLDIPNFDEAMEFLGQADLLKSKTACLEEVLKDIDFNVDLTDDYCSESEEELPEVLT